MKSLRHTNRCAITESRLPEAVNLAARGAGVIAAAVGSWYLIVWPVTQFVLFVQQI